jgi:hypothetical protein
MSQNKDRKLDLNKTLLALDRKDLEFYDSLTAEEKKSYTPLILMRYMSLLTDQNPNIIYAVLATNDLVNLGFWQLTKYPDLQHLLLCLAGTGSKQYHSWIPVKNKKRSNKLHSWVLDLYPDYNEAEIKLFLSKFTADSFNEFLRDLGMSDTDIKEMVTSWKKYHELT